MTANLDSVFAQLQADKLRGLAVAGKTRAREVPDPTAIAETYPEVVSTSWSAVVAPPKTPPEIAAGLSQRLRRKSCASRRSSGSGAR